MAGAGAFREAPVCSRCTCNQSRSTIDLGFPLIQPAGPAPANPPRPREFCPLVRKRLFPMHLTSLLASALHRFHEAISIHPNQFINCQQYNRDWSIVRKVFGRSSKPP
ncbi:MAG: hypothetical protein JWP89_5655 [Schlesneria sp.]|nr:hypothetical protein [Schlesneria sp.]